MSLIWGDPENSVPSVTRVTLERRARTDMQGHTAKASQKWGPRPSILVTIKPGFAKGVYMRAFRAPLLKHAFAGAPSPGQTRATFPFLPLAVYRHHDTTPPDLVAVSPVQGNTCDLYRAFAFSSLNTPTTQVQVNQ